MRCLDVSMELQAYVDSELSPGRAALFEQHLADCDDCQAELTRLQAVETALESWPLVVEPADLTARVMARVTSRSALPSFQLRWGDFAISLAGAGLVFAAMLVWRHLASTDLAYLYQMQIGLRLEMLRLETLLMAQRLISTGAVTQGLLLGSVALATALSIAVWSLTTWNRKTLSM